jgi:hypothetical protein
VARSDSKAFLFLSRNWDLALEVMIISARGFMCLPATPCQSSCRENAEFVFLLNTRMPEMQDSTCPLDAPKRLLHVVSRRNEHGSLDGRVGSRI